MKRHLVERLPYSFHSGRSCGRFIKRNRASRYQEPLYRWRTKYESDILISVARRPQSETVLSREELAEFSRRLSLLSTDGVEGVYRTAYRECAYDGRRIPAAAAVQQLVAAWGCCGSLGTGSSVPWKCLTHVIILQKCSLGSFHA